SCGTLRSERTLRPGITLWSGGTLRSSGALRSGGAGQAFLAFLALVAFRPLNALRSLRPRDSSRPLRPCRPLRPGRTNDGGIELGVVLVAPALERSAGGAPGRGPAAFRHVESIPRRRRPACRDRAVLDVPGTNEPRLPIHLPVANRNDSGREHARRARIGPLALLVVVFVAPTGLAG